MNWTDLEGPSNPASSPAGSTDSSAAPEAAAAPGEPAEALAGVAAPAAVKPPRAAKKGGASAAAAAAKPVKTARPGKPVQAAKAAKPTGARQAAAAPRGGKVASDSKPPRPRKVASASAIRPLPHLTRAEVDCEVLRDSFTIPKEEYLQLDALKRRALALPLTIKKSELLRAGLKLLSTLDDADLAQALAAVPLVKTGRPKGKGEKAKRRKD